MNHKLLSQSGQHHPTPYLPENNIKIIGSVKSPARNDFSSIYQIPEIADNLTEP
jgi:hypothetical protein